MTDVAARLTTALTDRYRIERELGQGGMATVYLAEDLKHGRRVAIKVLHAELSAVLGPERFLKEIALTASPQHPHILPLFDSGSAGGLLYYVMPYVEGESLRGQLQREKQLPIADALRVATEVADALAYAHARGVIHRDIKPENILLQGGHSLVADFGIALAVEQAAGGSARMTQTGLSLGTPQYMAPEQAMGERHIDARADIYALGAVTYEMLSGEPPFTGPTAQAVVAKMMTERPRRLSVTRETVPPAVDDAVSTALARLPADRFASATDFALALADRTPSRSPTVDRATPAREPGRWKPLALGALALAATTSVVALWGWRRADPAVFPAALSVSLPAGIAVQPQIRPALSPDGTRLVFAAAAGGKQALYVRELRDMTVRALSGTDGASDIFFSPDGGRIGFAAAGALWVVALSGGAPEQVPGTNDGSIDLGAGADGATWTADDAILYAPRYPSRRGILRVPATGGTPRVIAQPDTLAGQTALSQPQVLPGGRSLLTIVTVNGSRDRVGLVSLATGRPQLIGVRAIAVRYAAAHLVYTTGDGTVFVAPFDAARGVLTGQAVRLQGIDGLVGTSLGVSDAGTLAYLGGAAFDSHLVEVDRAGKANTLDDSARSYQVPRVSPDGARIAISVGSAAAKGRDIWLFDVHRHNLTRLTFGGDNVSPLWSPDGRRVAFAASVAGTYQILARSAGGTGPVDTLVAGAAFHFPGAYSPDGQWLVYRQNDARTSEDLYAISLDGHHTVRTLVASRFSEISPTLSPDGRWLAYVSDESGRREIYVRPFAGDGGALQISVAGGDEPRWAPDSREMFFRTSDSLFAVPVKAGVAGLTAGNPLALFADPYNRSSRYSNYDVLPNGSGFIMLAPRRDAGIELRVVTGWPALLPPAGHQ